MKKKLSVICLAFLGLIISSEVNAEQYEEEELFQNLEEMDRDGKVYDSDNGIMKSSYVDEIKKEKNEEEAEEAKNAAVVSKNIEMGTINFLKFKEVIGEIFIADDKIADINMLSEKSFYISGVEPGVTSLIVRDKKDRILADYKVTVTHRLSDVKKAIAEVYPNLDIKMTSMKDNIIVKGSVASPEMAEDVMNIVERFVDQSKVINKLTIETATQVLLKVKIAEVSRQVTKSLGIDWRTLATSGDSKLSGMIGVSAGAADNLKTIKGSDPITEAISLLSADVSGGRWFVSAGMSNLTALIDAAATETFASILAEPNLVALSGKSATFKSGGEYGYLVTQSNSDSKTTEFKNWGTSLEFTPVVLSEDRINIKVKTEVSSIGKQATEKSAPELDTKNVETYVELGSGQSMVLAGLLQKTSKQTTKETPLLADIPLIGSLFRSTKPEIDERELVIIVTPYIVKPSSKKLKTPVDMVPRLLSPFKAITGRGFHSTNNKVADSAGFSLK